MRTREEIGITQTGISHQESTLTEKEQSIRTLEVLPPPKIKEHRPVQDLTPQISKGKQKPRPNWKRKRRGRKMKKNERRTPEQNGKGKKRRRKKDRKRRRKRRQNGH